MELTINGVVYNFIFGMGFLNRINKLVQQSVANMVGVKQDIGFRYYLAGMLDGDVQALVRILDIANAGQNPRATKVLLESYFDDPTTDIDFLFEQVTDFLSKSNATKKFTAEAVEAVEKAKAAAQ